MAITHEGQFVAIWVNQGTREANVLAILGEEALVEYAMPNGTTALRVLKCEDEAPVRGYSYQGLPNRWLTVLYAAGTQWVAEPQQAGIRQTPSVAELYRQRKLDQKGQRPC